MIYYKTIDNVPYALDSKDFENFLPIGCVEISESEAMQLAKIQNEKMAKEAGLI